MDRVYWDKISQDYQEEVLSVFDNDLQGVVEERIATVGVASPGGRAADIGCGVGRFTLLLSELFDEVEACDFSTVGLSKAKHRCRDRSNIRFHQIDLTQDPVPFDPVEFAFCVNVLIMPSLDQRLRAWRAVVNQVVFGGVLLLVLPSLESAQMEYYAAIDSRLSEGERCSEAIRLSSAEKARAADLRMGIHQLDGVRTKHYLRDEIHLMLENRGFAVEESLRLKYPSQDESSTDSWDWLVLARRR